MAIWVAKSRDYKDLYEDIKLNGTDEWTYKNFCYLVKQLLSDDDFSEYIERHEKDLKNFKYESVDLEKKLDKIRWLKEQDEFSKKLSELLKKQDINKYNRAVDQVESLNSDSDELAWDYFMGWQSPTGFDDYDY